MENTFEQGLCEAADDIRKLGVLCGRISVEVDSDRRGAFVADIGPINLGARIVDARHIAHVTSSADPRKRVIVHSLRDHIGSDRVLQITVTRVGNVNVSRNFEFSVKGGSYTVPTHMELNERVMDKVAYVRKAIYWAVRDALNVSERLLEGRAALSGSDKKLLLELEAL